jgi:hypothetical protein
MTVAMFIMLIAMLLMIAGALDLAILLAKTVFTIGLAVYFVWVVSWMIKEW